MKKLTLIRHGKSDWSDITLDDHDRPLNKRGLRDVPFMADLMMKNNWSPDAFYSSTAQRTMSTTSLFIKAMNLEGSIAMETNADIYLADPITLMSVIHDFPNNLNHVALVGHNPGLTELTNYFMENGYIDNLPTCGLVEIIAPSIGKWKNMIPEKAEVKEIHFPKKYA